MAIDFESGKAIPHFFDDFCLADFFCHEEVRKQHSKWRILTLSRAIKLILSRGCHLPPDAIRDFREAIAKFPVRVNIGDGSLADLLTLDEYIPVTWHKTYHPLSRCSHYHIIQVIPNSSSRRNIKARIIYTSQSFPVAVSMFRQKICSMQSSNVVANAQLLLAGQFANWKLGFTEAG